MSPTDYIKIQKQTNFTKIQQQIQLGIQYHQSGQLQAAEVCYQQVLQWQPNYADAWHLLGVIAYQQQEYLTAIERIQRAIEQNAGDANFYNHLGLAFQGQGNLAAAVQSYQRGIQLNPNASEAHLNLGNVFQEQGNLAAAIESYQHAIKLNPNLPEVHNNLGNVLKEQKKSESAIASYQRAIQLKPDYVNAHYNLGLAFQDDGRLELAIASYQRALELKPDYVNAHYNLGLALQDRGNSEAAIESYQLALQFKPDCTQAKFAICLSQLPVIYANFDEIRLRRHRYQQHLESLARFYQTASQKERENAADAVGSLQPYFLAYQGLNDRDLQQVYGQMICQIMSSRYPQRAQSLPLPVLAPNEKVRVGFVSGCFYRHSVWKIPLKGWVENLDRNRFELFGYHTGCKRDEETDRASQSFSKFIQGIRSIEQWIEIISQDKLHILIFPELGMEPITLKLSCLKLAPIQATSWGHPETSGMPTIDYHLSSDLMEPENAQKHYTERLVKLPNLGIHYTPLDIPLKKLNKTDIGLENDEIMFWCCQTLQKYLPQHDDVFPRIVLEVTKAKFVFIEYRKSQYVTEVFRQRLSHAFEKFGLDYRDYCIFLPYLDGSTYAGVSAIADLFLDSIGWSGCNTTIEAVACNVPIVTWPGDLMRGRHTLAILKMMGIEATIAASKDDYVKIAVRLGQDCQYRQFISQQIAENKYKLYGDLKPIRALEDFLLNAVNKNVKSVVKSWPDGQEAHPKRDIQRSAEAIEQQLDLGIAHHQVGEFTQAQACYEQVLQWQPARADAWHLLGVIAYQQEEYLTAIAQIDRAIELNANAANFYNSLGSVYQKLRQFDRSLECYQKVIQLEANFFKAHNNIGLIYQEKGQFQDAIASYQQAIQLQPNYAEAYLNLSIAYDKQTQLTRAIECCQKAIQLKPEYADAYCQLGRIFSKQVKPKETVQSYQRALQIDPNYAVARHHLMFSLLYYSCDYEPSAIYAEHRKWAECLGELLAEVAEGIGPYDNNPTPERRLRIGYVSGDFKTHSVTYFFEPLLALHNSRDFEVICYANNTTIDATTQRLRQLADGWREIFTLNDAQVAELIRKDKIDILVDLSGHTMDNRLLVFARKPAPIQVTYLGYPSTTGLDTIDYRLTDAWADPQGETEHLHAEQLVRLPHGFLCYLPATNCPDVSPPPVLKSNQITFGCFNNLTKVNPESIGCWAKILRSVPNSRLIIKSKPLVDADNCAYLHGLFQQYGIERERVQLIGWLAKKNQHLDLYNQVDIALDTFPYHGTTTTCEAMWMGVPIITQAGKTHVSRVGVSLLSSVGLEALIAESAEDYIQKAVNLANDREQLQEVRSHLRQRMQASPLTNASLISSSLEKAYRAMWRRFCDPSSWDKSAVIQQINYTQIQQQFEFGFKHHQSGQIQAAAACYHQVLEWQPNHADAWHLLGVIAAQQKQYQIAIERISRAIALNSKSPSFYQNLGNVYQEQGQLSQAIASYHKVIQLQPEYTDAYKNLGIAYKKQGQWTEATLNSAIAHQLTGEFQLAIASYQETIKFQPDCALAHYNLGRAYKEQGQWTQAIECFDRAIQLESNYIDAHLSRGLTLLLLGDFQQGLLEYEWRFQTQQFNDFKQLKVPMWDGSPLEGKSIVLGNEQGLGDALQFVRYAPQLREQGARVILSTHPALVSLFRECLKGQFEVVESSRCNVYNYDRHVSLMSLPHIFKTSLETIPNCTPYIVLPDSLRDRCILPSSHFYRIGIVWATGKLNTQLYQQKSCKPELFMNLLDLGNISLYSLQVGEDASQIQPWLNHQHVCDCSPLLKDFVDTACAIEQLDLVITVDTAVAHLAGAMGKPVWVLLPFVPDWRWLLERQDSPWYPTMELFRQPSSGDWASVFSQVKAKLTEVFQGEKPDLPDNFYTGKSA